MPANPWVAIDATASPSVWARELQRIWDDFVSQGRLDQVRRPIADSWRRSRLAGIDPSRSRAPTTFEDRREVRERWEAHPLQADAPLIRRWLGRFADESDNLIVVSDPQGLLLWLEGDARIRSAAADAMNFVEGALWSEAGAGTNAIGTALAARRRRGSSPRLGPDRPPRPSRGDRRHDRDRERRRSRDGGARFPSARLTPDQPVAVSADA